MEAAAAASCAASAVGDGAAPISPPIRAEPLTPPNGEVIALLGALANPSDHARHTSALAARDAALTSSGESLGNLACNFARVFACPSIEGIPTNEADRLRALDPAIFDQLNRDPGSWKYTRMMAGVLLKNAIVYRGAGVSDMGADGSAGSGVSGGSGVTMSVSSTVSQHREAQAHEQRMQHLRPPPDAVQEIKSILLRCLVDGDSSIRKTAGTTISACCCASSDIMSLEGWPELLPFLISCLQHHGGSGGVMTGGEAIDGALDCLRKLCEDIPSRLDFDVGGGQRPLNTLMPLFVAYLSSPVEGHRASALECLNSFVETMPTALGLNMEGYLGGLSQLATDGSAKVRRLVCRGIVSLLSLRTEYLHPHFASVAQFMLAATSDTNGMVALEACEFWLTFAALDDDVCAQDMVDVVREKIPHLIPVLLRGMVYPPDKVAELLEENAIDESGAADRVEDIAPVFHKSRTAMHHQGGAATGAPGVQTAGGGKNGTMTDVNNDGDEELDDDGGENGGAAGGEESNEWSLRKCSAASLDILAGMYGASEVLPVLLPTLQEGLNHTDPWVREASILALGAVAEGCHADMEEHMPALCPFLLSQLSAELPQLRGIACWTLSRYSSWIVLQVESGEQVELVAVVTETLMKLILDRNKKVQIASCSAFGVMTEAFGELLVPYLEPIYRTLASAMSIYRTRSFMVLCDTLGVMADFIGSAIGEGSLSTIYIPPLVEVWMNHKDPLDTMLLPLMECLACLALALGHNFQPWALHVFDKCMSTIEACMLSVATHTSAAGDQSYHGPRDEDSDPIVCSADLLDGMVEGMESNFETLVKSSTYADQFLPVLHALCQSDVPGVRMSAFALVGDLSHRAPAIVEPGIPEILAEAISCIDPLYPSVCNNSVWAIGEICVRCGKNAQAMSPFAGDIVAGLIPILMGNSSPDGHSHGATQVPGLAENAATTIGRLARIDPIFVKDDLPRFLSGWCEGLARIADFTERCQAFEGFVLAIHSNPQIIFSPSTLSSALRNKSPTPQVQQSSSSPTIVAAIIFAIVSWHVPVNEQGIRSITPNILLDESSYSSSFIPFPSQASELGTTLGQLLVQMKNALGHEEWEKVSNMPANVRRLLSEYYHI